MNRKSKLRIQKLRRDAAYLQEPAVHHDALEKQAPQ